MFDLDSQCAQQPPLQPCRLSYLSQLKPFDTLSRLWVQVELEAPLVPQQRT